MGFLLLIYGNVKLSYPPDDWSSHLLRPEHYCQVPYLRALCLDVPKLGNPRLINDYICDGTIAEKSRRWPRYGYEYSYG